MVVKTDELGEMLEIEQIESDNELDIIRKSMESRMSPAKRL
jgi:hypothetical protein